MYYNRQRLENMKLFPTLSGDKETIFGEVKCTLLTRFSSTLFDRKTEIKKVLC